MITGLGKSAPGIISWYCMKVNRISNACLVGKESLVGFIAPFFIKAVLWVYGLNTYTEGLVEL